MMAEPAKDALFNWVRVEAPAQFGHVAGI